jgi:hypothetical protein
MNIFYTAFELISKRLKSVTPAKIGAQKRAENTGEQLSPERQQQTFEIGSFVYNYHRSHKNEKNFDC